MEVILQGEYFALLIVDRAKASVYNQNRQNDVFLVILAILI